MRPHQWVKNGFVLAPLVFSLNIDSPQLLLAAAAAFGCFCLLSSAVYLLNDIVDIEADRAHPVKCRRPIPSGDVPLGVARLGSFLLCAVALVGLLLVAWPAAVAAGTYFVINIAYSLKLKHIPYVDVIIIASGFLIRILTGSLAIDVEVSIWLFSCTFLLALYLALGKRRHELADTTHSEKQRLVLSRYDIKLVHAAMALVGTLTVAVYAAYTLAPSTQHWFGFPWPRLAVTIPLVGYGVYRFFQLTNPGHSRLSPTEALLRDPRFLLNIGAWVVVVLVLVYGL